LLTAHFFVLPGYGSDPKAATVQATWPDSVFTTHLSLMPNDTWRFADPMWQVSRSSAHFEKPDGQSTASAGVEHSAAIAAQRRVFWFMTVFLVSLKARRRPPITAVAAGLHPSPRCMTSDDKTQFTSIYRHICGTFEHVIGPSYDLKRPDTAPSHP
jgi:hypothetical protein